MGQRINRKSTLPNQRCFFRDDHGLDSIPTEEDIISGLVHNCTGKPMHLIHDELHHQIDPSYLN